MEEVPAQQVPTAPNPKVDSGFKPSHFLPLVIVLVLGLVAGAFVTKMLLPSKSTGPVKVADAKLPIATSLLTNPIVSQWRGSVEGVLTAKDENSITIADEEGNSLTVPLKVSDSKNMTLFYDRTSEASASADPRMPVELDLIKVGSYLRGDFFVVGGEDNSRIVGSSFTAIDQPK